MQKETIIEKGIVISASGGRAKIMLDESGKCEECSAKLFCKPAGSKDAKILEVEDSLGVNTGDSVNIEIIGSDILKASVMLYGVPMIILILGILFGMSIFSGSSLKELCAFLFASGLTIVYAGILLVFNKIKPLKQNLPKIITVTKTVNDFPALGVF
ncbi:MAG: SoxR reducing system RseC family protein [Melioribacteraceae bacterium]|nr:SoxR reducing system RseC family protein [Melioribacteraceae bacterium]